MSSESIQQEIMASEDDSADAVLQGSIPTSIPSAIQTSFSQQNEGITPISTVSLPETMSTAEAIVATESISVGTQVVPDSTLSAQVIEDNISQVHQHEPVSVTCSGTQESIVISTESVGIAASSSSEGPLHLATLSAVPSNYPWATRLHDCELIGDSYRGYVTNEVELDLILTLHKQHTNSCWGTRQSPSSAKPSIRLMWKSQYVPYDGIPFLNTGRRATVMECQYGPRRKGAVNKKQVEYDDHGSPVKRHRPTCPARIYVKKVRKFPEFRIDPNLEGKNVRQAQERALTALRLAGVETGGEERYYVQLPLPIAHEYHDIDDIPMGPDDADSQGQRLNPDVMHKIRELVARGVTGIYTVKHCLKEYVEKELFVGMEPPPRHNKSFFPTIIDIQNHIHQAQMALTTGALLPLPPLTNLPTSSPQLKERTRKRKQVPEKLSQSSQTTAQAVACIQPQDESDTVQSFADQEQRQIMEQSSGQIHQGTETHHLEILHSSEGQTSDVDMSSQPQILITQGSRAGREDGQVVIVVTSNNLFTDQSDSDTPTTLSLTLPASQVASLSHASLQSGTGPAAVTFIPQQINTANSTTSSTNSQTVTFIPQAVDNSRTAVAFLSPDQGPDSSGQVSHSTAYLTAQGQSGSLLTVLDSAVQASVGGTAPVIRVGTNLGVQIADGSQTQNTVPGQILASQAAVEAVLSAATPKVERQQPTEPLESIKDEPPAKRANLGVDFASLVKEAVFDGQQVVNGQEQTKATPESEHLHLHMVTTATATALSNGTESQQIKLEDNASQNFIPMESHSVVMVTQPVLPSVQSGTGIVHVYQDSNSSLLGDGDDRLSSVDSQLYSDAQHTVSMSQSTVTEQVAKATLSHAVQMDTTSSDTRENDTNQSPLLSDEVQNTQSYELDDQATNTTAGEQDSLHIMFENGERISEEASGIVSHSTNTQGHVNLCSVQLMNTAPTVFTQ